MSSSEVSTATDSAPMSLADLAYERLQDRLVMLDIRPGEPPAAPQDLVVFQGENFFTAAGEDGLRELWRSDGDESSTVIVCDVSANPGSGTTPADLVEYNGLLYFTATGDVDGNEIYLSDGTAAGTVLVKDIIPGSGDSNYPNYLTDVNGTLFTEGVDTCSPRSLVVQSSAWRVC